MNPHPLPAGFRTAAHACGIKSDPSKLDLSLFVADGPCTAAGVFTQNRVVGAPVHISRERVPAGTVRGVVINSGNANACTGDRGLEDARWMTAEIARRIGCNEADVLVCSTGVIGHFLPREKLAAGFDPVVAGLDTSSERLAAAARGMMTTDTVHKLASRTLEVDGQTITITGAAKGAAMIAPNMATMLAVIMTDAALTPDAATSMLRESVASSFNGISVDGHTSTSDTVLLLASGTASGGGQSPDRGLGAGVRSAADGPDGVNVASQGHPGGLTLPPETDRHHARALELQTALTAVCTDLAQQIIRDAEGAEHFVTIDVTGCTTRDEAVRIARQVAESALVKTAVTGNDPNWGRIVSAAGYAGIPFAEAECSLAINGHSLYEAGTPVPHDEAAVSAAMATGEVHIALTFTRGPASTRFWTTDLTAEYVRLNSEYTT